MIIRSLRHAMLAAVSLLLFAAVGLTSLSAAAVTPAPDPATGNTPTTSSGQQACLSLGQVGTDQGCGKGQTVLNKVINQVVRIISYVAGIIAIIMVMVAGFQFITANGDSNNVARARRSLIYASLGIIIATVAQLLVHFVLTTSTVCPYNSSLSIDSSACVAPPTN